MSDADCVHLSAWAASAPGHSDGDVRMCGADSGRHAPFGASPPFDCRGRILKELRSWLGGRKARTPQRAARTLAFILPCEVKRSGGGDHAQHGGGGAPSTTPSGWSPFPASRGRMKRSAARTLCFLPSHRTRVFPSSANQSDGSRKHPTSVEGEGRRAALAARRGGVCGTPEFAARVARFHPHPPAFALRAPAGDLPPSGKVKDEPASRGRMRDAHVALQ